MYHQRYESGAAFWPDVHGRVLIGLFISQILQIGLLSSRGAEKESLVLLAQPILTIWFYLFCKGRFESAFVKFPLEVGDEHAYNIVLFCHFSILEEVCLVY